MMMSFLAATAKATSSEPSADWSAVIVHTPGVCSGQARIDGTRIKVKHVYVWVEEMGMTPSQVVEHYPHLAHAQVHAALAYYWSHEAEIRADMEREDKLVDEMKAKAGPSKLQAMIAEREARANTPGPHRLELGVR